MFNEELGNKGPAHFNIYPLLLSQGLVLVHENSFCHGWVSATKMELADRQ